MKRLILFIFFRQYIAVISKPNRIYFTGNKNDMLNINSNIIFHIHNMNLFQVLMILNKRNPIFSSTQFC